MRVLVCNRADPASANIRDRLLETDEWGESNRTFRGHPVWARSETVLVQVDGPTVTDEALDEDLKGTGWPVMDVWFLSKHVAASGHPSLTVHPIGNHGEAKFGGRADGLSPAAARDMGGLLRRLKHHASAGGLPHAITYESTHHGPHMSVPSLFVEIGSDLQWYNDPAGARVLALAINDVLAGEGRCGGPILVGIGGGHYIPRHTDLALAGKADFGHFLPSHFVEDAHTADRLRRAVAATPGCEGVYVNRKGLNGAQRQKALAWCAELDLKTWSFGGTE